MDPPGPRATGRSAVLVQGFDGTRPGPDLGVLDVRRGRPRANARSTGDRAGNRLTGCREHRAWYPRGRAPLARGVAGCRVRATPLGRPGDDAVERRGDLRVVADAAAHAAGRGAHGGRPDGDLAGGASEHA